MKLTVRTRFSLACGAVFFIVGGLLLIGVYVLVRSQLEPVVGWRDPRWIITTVGTFERGSWGHEIAAQREMQVRGLYQTHTLEALRNIGALALLAGTAVAMAIGWRAGGWAIVPLKGVTQTARQVSQSHKLTERIAHTGPKDEVGELADTFDAMLSRLSRSFDGQRRFVQNASHELRTPLTINRTLVDVALRRQGASEDMRRLGESLLVVNTRHERLIDGLLALAEGEQSVLDRHPFDLSDVVEHALDQAGKEAREREVVLHSLLDSAPTAGDPVLIERLVQNLIENGIRHNHSGGEVWVTTRQRADVVELVVANTGLMVAAYEVETIFQPFRRLHGDRINSDRGSGLGMSIVKALTEAHEGTVVARPRDEGGLTVTVELPFEA